MAARGLIRDISAVSGATVLLAVLGAGAMVVLAQSLPVDQFGRVSVLLLAFNLTSTFDAVRPVTIFFSQRYADKPKETFASIFWIDAGVGTILALLLAGIAVADLTDLLAPSELLCIAATFLLFFLQSAYWGWADAHGLVARTSLMRTVSMGGVYVTFMVLAAQGERGVGYSLTLLMAAALMLVLTWWICWSHRLVTRPSRPNRTIIRAIAAEVLRSMQFNLATFVLATVDRLAVYLVDGPKALGLYSGHFELATRPMALLRAAHAAVNPHVTHAVARREDVFPLIGLSTKVLFGAVSLTAWAGVLFRDHLTALLLGSAYQKHADIFAAVVLAQCFVLLGYASALLLNSAGNFSAQTRHYSIAAILMILLAYPAAQVGGVFAIAILYLFIRVVDLGLLYEATYSVGRKVSTAKAAVAGAMWLAASGAAWMRETIICMMFAIGLLLVFWRAALTEERRIAA